MRRLPRSVITNYTEQTASSVAILVSSIWKRKNIATGCRVELLRYDAAHKWVHAASTDEEAKG